MIHHCPRCGSHDVTEEPRYADHINDPDNEPWDGIPELIAECNDCGEIFNPSTPRYDDLGGTP